jgi:predicted O-methyltransferase YrrM
MNALRHKAKVLLSLLQQGDYREVIRRSLNLIRKPIDLIARRGAIRRVKAAVIDGPPLKFSAAELQRVLEAPVFLADEEITALSRYASEARGSIVEIGAAFGASSSVLLTAKPEKCRLYSIDPFVVDSMSQWSASERECRAGVGRVLAAAGKSEELKNWRLRVEPSYEAIKKWKTPIDLIFIDGDRHYDAVKQDFEDWFSHVRLGGRILIHDSRRVNDTPKGEFNMGWEGPTKLANELRKDPRVKLIDEAYSITAWEKTKAR